MWTYSGATLMPKIQKINFHTYSRYVNSVKLQQSQLRLAIRPTCVQSRTYSSNYFSKRPLGEGLMLKSSCLKINPSCYQKNAQVLLPSPINRSYYSTYLHTEEFNSDSLSSSTSSSENKEIDEEANSEEENELEVRRQLWDIGPATISSFNFAPYANDSITLQKLVQLGVAIHKWERMYGIPEFILKLDFQKHIEPYIRFLVDNGVEPDNLNQVLTKNPHVLKENFENLKARLNYLESKKFKREGITRIITENPFWLSFSTERIDQRLGFFQRTFKLSGQEVRELAVEGPKIITYNLNLIKDVTFKLKDEMGFEAKEIATILLAHPEIWIIHPTQLWRRFDYLHNNLKFSHEDLIRSSKLLLTSSPKLKERVGFLQKIGRAQFNPEKPNFVSVDNIVDGDDGQFAVNVAKRSVIDYNDYLKTL